jgi:hypothetical protein
MDPNATLRELRDLITRLIYLMDTQQDKKALQLVDELTILFQGLDKWITEGGFLPMDWKHE